MYKISVIIPTYNSEKTISRAIESVLNQSYSVFEIIIIDDASTDKTMDIVTKYTKVISIGLNKNKGASAARNEGIKKATGNWIAFLDSDDEWKLDKLEKQIIFLNKHNYLVWCCSKFSSSNKKMESKNDKNGIYTYFYAELNSLFHVHTITLLIRRDVFSVVGDFDLFFRRHQDWDLWWRIAYQYPEIGYIDEVLAIQHVDKENNNIMKYRIEGKKGKYLRPLIYKHLMLSKNTEQKKVFHKLAQKKLVRNIMVAYFLGFKSDAMETFNTFKADIPYSLLLKNILSHKIYRLILLKIFYLLTKYKLIDTDGRYKNYLAYGENADN